VKTSKKYPQGRSYEARCPRTHKYIRAGGTAVAALNLRNRLERQHITNEVTGNPNTLVSAVIEKWRALHSTQIKKSSMVAYEQKVRNHIEPRWARTKVKDITRSMVSAWLCSEVPAGSARTIRAAFSTIMEFAVE